MLFKSKKIIIYTFVIMLVLFGCLFCPHKIKPEQIAQINNAEYGESSHHWKTVYSDSDDFLINLRRSGIDTPDVDFSKHNLIISQGIEITDITYFKTKKLSSLKHKPYIGTANYGKVQNGTLYFYIIEKISIEYDIFTATI